MHIMYFSYSQSTGQKHEKKRVILPYYKEHRNMNFKTHEQNNERTKEKNTKIRKNE